ncbi:MAG: SEC-C domain-containing protein [Clostridiales Family XIII bacterium]|jgi:hypothetical protein|nr:SEC-C domain-containing protein [Clostridiales Family XIII bacterium]
MAKSLSKQWADLLDKQTNETFQAFWKDYSDAEQKLYGILLKDKELSMKGVFSSLADGFGVDRVLFMGWLDGLNTSLLEELAPEKITADSELDLRVDPEKLYYRMHEADADHLYSLPEWDGVLSEERRAEIATEYRRSRTVHKEKTPGRNDPCPCGSGKKYKKCCGA